jgi:diphthamide biosynthesis enzyme Dph1/Dph2-like protein
MALKVLHITAESDLDIMPVVEKALPLLSDDVAVVTTIQHKPGLAPVKKLLESRGKKATVYGHILGCSVPKMKEKTILYIGMGEFHPKGVALKGQEVVCANPLTMEVFTLTPKDMEQVAKRRKAAYAKFLHAETVGVILTVKSGQKTVQAGVARMLGIGKKYPDKRFYFFACDNLDFPSLENFPFIEVWVNTMCPRIGQDDTVRWEKPLLNIEDILGEKDALPFAD